MQSHESLFLLMILGVATGCGTSPAPSTAPSGVQDEAARRAPRPKPAVGASCPQMPALPSFDEPCNALEGRACLGEWSWPAGCGAVEPPEPVAGERVFVRFRQTPPDGQIFCSREQPRVSVIPGEVTTFRASVAFVPSGSCPNHNNTLPGDLYVIDLGLLPPGGYSLQAPQATTSFQVKASAPPPELRDLEQRAKLMVAVKNRPGLCFGKPNPNEGRTRVPFGEQRASRFMAELFPELPVVQRERAFVASRSVKLKPIGERRWTYEYADGGCCTTRWMRGEVSVSGDGHVEVGAAEVFGDNQQPC